MTILVYICVYNMRMCIYICMVCMVGPADPSAARCSGEVRLLGAVAAITLFVDRMARASLELRGRTRTEGVEG